MNVNLPKRLFMAVALVLMLARQLAGGAESDDPAAELASFHVRDGFEVNLFASEKDGVVKPIQSRFDSRGRLWVIGSTVYPQLEPGQVPNDKVIVLEDTDHDGRADRSTVFADGLFIPTGLEVTAGGCYVGNSTELLQLRDTDGDGRADVREILLRGFGTGDNHQNLNSFQWSPGGELWFSQGLHSHSRVETPWGVEKLDQAGIWRLRPRLLRLDPFFGHELAPHNPWGFVFDDWGQMLVLAGNGHGIYHPLPILIRDHRVEQLDQIWKDFRGRKLCGGDIVGNAHLPEDMQGTMVAGGFINNTVYQLGITEDGSSYAVSDLPPLLTSSDNRFRPVDVKIGPDGAVYVTDWYNPIIGHYQTSFRHPDRDKVHGRIWRISAKGRPLVSQPDLTAMSIPQLLEQIKSTDRWRRLHAKRRLADAPTEQVRAEMGRWISALDSSDPRHEHCLVEALGVFQAHEAVEPRLLRRLVSARDPRARTYAAEAVGRWQDRLDYPLELLRTLVRDPNARVRLAAVVSASYIRRPETVDVALEAVESPMDKFLDYALRQCVFVLKPQWLPGFKSRSLAAMKIPSRLEFLVKADATPDTVGALREFVGSSGSDPASREMFLGILAETGGPDDLARLLDRKTFTTANRYDDASHARLLGRIREVAAARKVRPSGDLPGALVALSGPREIQAAAVQLAALWKVEALSTQAMAMAFSERDDDEYRTAGAVALATLRGKAASTNLLELGKPERSAGERVAAAIALAPLDPGRAASIAASLLAGDLAEGRMRRLLNAFAQRRGGTASLAAAFKAQPPSRDSARIALRLMNGAGQADPKLVEALMPAAALGGEPLGATPEFVRALVAEVRQQGDAANGARVFQRADLACVTCHAIAGQGGNAGPDLNTIGSGQPLDFIIGAVLEPNREVKENYEAIEITTGEGETYTGYRAQAAPGEFALREATLNRVMRFGRDQIKEVKNRGSVMPPGLVDHLTRAELRDLFRYLSELGKPAR